MKYLLIILAVLFYLKLFNEKQNDTEARTRIQNSEEKPKKRKENADDSDDDESEFEDDVKPSLYDDEETSFIPYEGKRYSDVSCTLMALLYLLLLFHISCCWAGFTCGCCCICLLHCCCNRFCCNVWCTWGGTWSTCSCSCWCSCRCW